MLTREPGGTPVGEGIRRLLLEPEYGTLDGLTELFLLLASRRSHVEQRIRPALERGEVVLCDRYADSSVAYQGGGRRLGLERVEELNRLATGGLMPDLTILLDLSAAEGLRRITARPGAEDRLESEARAFHERVRGAYLEIARRRGGRYRVLDGAGAVAGLAREIWEAVSRLL
ncbi:MAG: dTMP kinase [Candidatus Eisenbacteria bacterium]|nr:dTMP kinase [Candidatus Eisenbacteria bacterium]